MVFPNDLPRGDENRVLGQRRCHVPSSGDAWEVLISSEAQNSPARPSIVLSNPKVTVPKYIHANRTRMQAAFVCICCHAFQAHACVRTVGDHGAGIHGAVAVAKTRRRCFSNFRRTFRTAKTTGHRRPVTIKQQTCCLPQNSGAWKH